MTTLGIAFAALWALAAPLRAEDQPMSKEFPAEKIKLVEVQTELGPVRVAGTDAKAVKADVLDPDPVRCRVLMELRGKTLLLKAERPKKWLFDSTQCPSGFRVGLPRGMALDIATGTGSAEVASHTGKLSVRSGTGNVSLVGVSGPVSAKVGSASIEGEASSNSLDLMTGNGAIRLKGLKGGVSAQSGNGEIDLAWASKPHGGRCEVRTGSGDITLTFPDGSKLAVKALSAAGKLTNEFPEPPIRGFKVSAISGTGNIGIRKPAVPEAPAPAK
jgi:DUF4097 and DUF4098 domain-containing protein YvlB